MSEQELKLHVPRASREGIQRAMQRGALTALRLRARYFDTPERFLAKAGIALRLRQEGRQWVQTLKMAGDNPLSRLELNHLRPNATLDLSVYEDSPARKTIKKAAKHLDICYETDIKRLFRRIRTPAGVVEAAYDLGEIRAGELTLPVSEIEFELISGRLQAVFLLGLKWQAAHALVLDLRSKAERGDRLATLAQRLAGMGDLDEPATVAARAAVVADFWRPRPVNAIELTTDLTCGQALATVTLECLEQIARNSATLAEVDTAGVCVMGTPEHVHQLRVGIRRLRSCWSLYKGLAPLPPDDWQQDVKVHFSALGTARDDDVMRDTLLPVLNAAGQPPVELKQQADDTSPKQLTGSIAFQTWLIEMLAWAVQGHPIQTVAAGDEADEADVADVAQANKANKPHNGADLTPRLKKKLFKWHKTVLAKGLDFGTLEIEAKHDLRKRTKRLRYGLQFSESLLPTVKLKNYRKQLSKIQDVLGEMNDLYVAQEKFEGIRNEQPPAWFAVGWIASRLEVLGKEAQQAFVQLKQADHFWE